MEVLATEYFECLKFTIVPKAIGKIHGQEVQQ